MRHRILKGGIMHALGLASLAMLLVPNAAHAGHWVFTGTVNNGSTTSSQTSYSSWSDGGTDTVQQGSGNYTLNATITINVTGTWILDYPGDTSQPLPSMLVTANNEAVSASPTGQSSGSVTVSDGEGDSQVNSTVTNPPNTVLSGVSSGKHLVPVTNGAVTIMVTMTATGSGTAGAGGGGGVTIAPDPRTVSISTSLPQTSSKPTTVTGSWTNAVPVANLTTGNPIYVDTVDPIPAPEITIGYSASAAGTWANYSSYLWNFSISGYSTNGLFNPVAIPGVTNQYTYPTANTGTQEHAYIHLTDATDGANATGNLYVRFHNQWEDFIPDVTNLTTQETYIIPGVGVQNNGSTPITPSFTQTISGTVNFQAALNGGFTLTNLGTLGITFTPSTSVSSSGATTVPGPTIQPGYYSTPDLYCYYKRDNCVVDEYGTAGYLGTLAESYDNPTPMTLTIGWTAVAKIP